jgi:hypothetical protein
MATHDDKKSHGSEAHGAHGGPSDAKGEGHGGPAHASPAKGIGITMALLGVMLAVCAALVGSARTELVASTIDQANKIGVQQAEGTKFRVMDTDRELLHALTPSKGEVAKFESALKNVRSKSGKADDEDTSEVKDIIDVSTRSIAEVLTPDPEDEDRIEKLRKTYAHDLAEAKEDAEAYDGAIHAHEREAEGYERAQLCAEIGIVVASIALLVGSRAVWLVAIAVGLLGVGNAVTTRISTSRELAAAEQKIEDAQKNTAAIEAEDSPGEAPGHERQEEGKPPEPKEKGRGGPEEK